MLDPQNHGDRTIMTVVELSQPGGRKSVGELTPSLMEAVFGPQWRAVVSLVRAIADLDTNTDLSVLDVADGDVQDAARAAWDAARNDNRASEMSASKDAAVDAIYGLIYIITDAWEDEAEEDWPLVRSILSAVVNAAVAVASWDLARADGPYTPAHRDLLLKQWSQVRDLPEGLVG